MIPDLLNLLTPEERAAWALCEGATPGPWVDMTSAGHDVGAFDGEIRAALSFAHICSDVPGDDRKNDRAFIAGSRDALPAALTTIATLRAEHVAYRANADDLFQEMRVRGEALQRDLRDAESAASVEASEADRLRAELRAVADLIQEVGVLGIASTMDAVVVSGQPSARDLLTWAAKAMDAWPEERQALRAEVAELRAALANDRGEGEPPSEGWKRNETGESTWEKVLATQQPDGDFDPEPTDILNVYRDGGSWAWERRTDQPGKTLALIATGRADTARACMRAADDAVKGAT